MNSFLFHRWTTPPAKDHPFFVSSGQVLTYGWVEEQIQALFSRWQTLGLQPGDSLFLAVADDIPRLLCTLTALRHGITLMMWNPHAPRWESEQVLELANPTCLCLDESLLHLWEIAHRPLPAKGVMVVEGLNMKIHATPASRNPPQPGLEEVAAYVLFTSGTTDLPKGVVISPQALSSHLETLSRHLGYSGSSRLLNPLPWHHTDGLVEGPLLAWYNGATLVRPNQLNPQDMGHLLQLVMQEGITHMVSVPTLLSLMLRLGEDYRHAFQNGSFAVLVSTGGHLEEGLWRKFEEFFQVVITNIYGLTETVVGGLFCGPDSQTRRFGSLGKPVDCRVEIRSAEGEVLETGQVGELWMTGDHLMSGYLHQLEATQSVMVSGWLRTGDLVSRDPEGFFHFHGRKKNVLKRGGQAVFPEQITEVLNLHPQVVEAVVIGRADPVWEEVPVAFVVMQTGAGLTGRELAAFCRSRLAEYKVPRAFYWVDALPKGPAGKILLAQIRNWLPPAEEKILPATLDIPQQVAALAAGCFNISVSALNGFSSPRNTPGWDSLSFMELVVQLEEYFNIVLEVREILQMDSLAAIQRLVVERLQQADDGVEEKKLS